MLVVRRPRTPSLALALAALLAGCAAPDPAEELVLVPRAAEPEQGEAPRWELTLRGAAVPLPESDAFQTVRSLSVEVAAPGRYDLSTADGGARLVRVTDGEATLRALIERPRIDSGVPLPASLADLSPTLEAAAWVDAAASRGVTARVAQGVERTSEGRAVPCRWPEALIDGDWLPIDVAERRCSLAAARVRVALDLLAPEGHATVDLAPR